MKADQIARQVYNELLTRIGLSLSEAGLRLPDIIELDRKRDFEQQTVGQLREALAQGRFAHLNDLLSWLRTEVSSMTPGADPLPALKAPIAYLCTQWSKNLAASPVLAELARWARQ